MPGMGSRKDTDLYHVESGRGGPPILLLHGLHESSAGYHSAMRYLESLLHVYALDFRGHGDTPWQPPYRVQDYASDVIEFIQAKIGEPLFLAGHSLGGLVAAYVASHQPDMVHALILEDPPLYIAQMPVLRETALYPMFVEVRRVLQEHHDSGGSAEDLEEVVREWQAASGAEIPRFARELHSSDPRTVDPILDGTLFEGFNPDEDLPKIVCRVLLIAGGYEQGGLLRPQDIEKVLSLIPTCLPVVWDDLGHDIHTVRPKEYSQEILSFVRTIAPLA
jgi:pimeloyl-ACP methyl ester carboxylesterase